MFVSWLIFLFDLFLLYYIIYIHILFFYLGFLLRTFTNHRTVGEGVGHFFNSSLPLPPASQTLSWAATAESSPLHIARGELESNREPLISECKSLTTNTHTTIKFVLLNFIIVDYFILLYHCYQFSIAIIILLLFSFSIFYYF